MPNQEKRFVDRGMDLDTASELLPNGKTRALLNMRTGTPAGKAIRAKGNKLIANVLPAGTNKTIGSYLDETENQLYYFNYNSTGQHGIYRWLLGSATITTVLVDPLLNFNPDFLITGVDMAYIEPNNPILGWTDGGATNTISPTIIRNPPRSFLVNKAIAYSQGDFVNGYPAITVQVLDQIKYPPLFSPSVAMVNDSQYNKNNLRGRLFQFKYRYVYDDFSKSAWSPISELAVPVGDEFIGNAFVPTGYLNNRIDVTLLQGSITCVSIEIAVRVENSTNSDFSLWDTVSNFLTPTATFPFYNDKNLLQLDLSESVKLFDDLPRVAQAQTITPTNRRLWGNVVNQFNLVEPEVTFTPVYTDLPVPTTAPTPTWTNVTTPPIITSVLTFLGGFPIQPPAAFYPEGTVLDFGAFYGQYVVPDSTLGSWSAFLTGVGDFLVSKGATSYIIGSSIVPPLTVSQIQVIAPVANGAITVKAAGSIVKYSSFKSGAVHPFGMVYYDRANRSTSVIRNPNFDVYAKFITELPYTPPQWPFRQISIDWAINHTPPIDATHYQFVYAGDSLTSSFIQFTVKAATNTSTQTEIQLNPLDDYNTAYLNSILSYSYTAGDRMRVMFVNGIGVPDTYIDVAVTAYDESTFKLTTDLIPLTTVTFTAGSLIEIYTPRNLFVAEEAPYFEFSEQFEIGDAGLPTRYHKGETQDQTPTQPATGTFNHGDVWMRNRRMTGANATDYFTFTVEDFNLSDFYISNVWGKGRPNIYDKDFKETNRPTTIYYSQFFIPETNVNGLGSVFPLNYGSDDIKISLNWRSIQRLYAEGDNVFCFQELKTCVVPINNQTTIDVNSGQIAGATDRVLNQVRYFGGYGINKNPESLIYHAGRFYHADVLHGVWLRLSNDGYTPISQLRGQSGEIAAINNLTQSKFSEISNFRRKVNIPAAYDVRYDSAIFSIEDTQYKQDLLEGFTVSFFEGNNFWESFWSYRPEWLARNAQELISFKDGQLYIHDKNPLYSNFYGTQYNAELSIVCNEYPSVSKVWMSNSLESNKAVDVPIITTSEGNVSNLLIQDFEDTEGKWYAGFWFDQNTPNVTNPLINGDSLRGYYMEILLQDKSSDYFDIFAVNFVYNASPPNR